MKKWKPTRKAEKVEKIIIFFESSIKWAEKTIQMVRKNIENGKMDEKWNEDIDGRILCDFMASKISQLKVKLKNGWRASPMSSIPIHLILSKLQWSRKLCKLTNKLCKSFSLNRKNFTALHLRVSPHSSLEILYWPRPFTISYFLCFEFRRRISYIIFEPFRSAIKLPKCF